MSEHQIQVCIIVGALLLALGIGVGGALGKHAATQQHQESLERVRAAAMLYAAFPRVDAAQMPQLDSVMQAAREPEISLEQCQRIQQGMTYNQVVLICGRDGVLESHTEFKLRDYLYVSESYSWKRGGEEPFPDYLRVSFEDGYVKDISYTN